MNKKEKRELKQILQEQKKMKWERFVGRGGHPVLLMDTIRRSLVKFNKPVLNLPNFKYWKRYDEASFFAAEELARVRSIIKKRWQHPSIIENNIKELEKIIIDLLQWAKIINEKDPTALSVKQAQVYLKKFFTKTDLLWTSAYFPMIADQAFNQLWHDSKINISEEQINQYARPEKLTVLQKKGNEFWKTKKKFGRQVPKAVLRALRKKYEWSRSYVFLIRPYSLRDVRQDLKNAKLNKRRSKVVIPMTLSKYKNIFLAARQMVEFRDKRLIGVNKFFYYLYPFLAESARRTGIGYSDFIQLSVSEILAGKFKKSIIKIRQRARAYLVWNKKGYIITGRHLRYLKTGDQPSATKKIKGITSYPGKVSGIVRRVNPYIYQEIKKGDIIVTGMTTPEIVPYLGKVKAIVTDEGGVTSHASIVAREFKIPTIIGTRIATQVLRDGDLVEVNANEGVVRKIKSR